MENVDLVREATELGPDATREDMERLLHPDFQMDMSARELNPYVYRGYDGVERFYSELGDAWTEIEVTPLAIEEEGDRVLLTISAVFRSRQAVELPPDIAFQVWEVKDGRATRMTLHVDEDPARADLEGK